MCNCESYHGLNAAASYLGLAVWSPASAHSSPPVISHTYPASSPAAMNRVTALARMVRRARS